MLIKNLDSLELNKRSCNPKNIFICDTSIIKAMTDQYQFTVWSSIDDDGFTTIRTLEIEAGASSMKVEEAYNSLARILVGIAMHRYHEIATRKNVPNDYIKTIPYLLKILICEDEQEVIDICLKGEENKCT